MCINRCIATVTALLVAQQRATNTLTSIVAWRLTAEMCLPLRYVATSEALPSNERDVTQQRAKTLVLLRHHVNHCHNISIRKFAKSFNMLDKTGCQFRIHRTGNIVFQNTNTLQTDVVRFYHTWGNSLRPRWNKAKSATGNFSRAGGEFSAPFLPYGENSRLHSAIERNTERINK
jgi:hypothetical protein